MEIGDQVHSHLYMDKGHGRIVDVISLDGTNYYEIYFPTTNDVLTLDEKDVQQLTSPLDKLKLQKYDNSQLFKLRIIAEKLDSLLYQDKLITANNFKIMPLPHQVLAVNQVLEQFMPRCLLADEVGLGKTIEAALIYEELKLRNIVKRILIVTPAGLTTQWKDEMKIRFNENFSVIDRNTARALRDLHGNVNIWKKYDYVITSLDFLKPKVINDSLSKRELKLREDHNKFITANCIGANWDMVVFDEAHKLSKDSDGSETSRYKIGKSLSEISPIFILLTATPHQGDSAKFRHLLKLIDEYKFYSSESLTPENVRSVTIKNKKRAATDFKGNLLFKSRVASIAKIERHPEDIEVQLYHEVSEYISQYYNLASREGNFAFMFLLILYQRMISSSSRAIYHSLHKRLNLLSNLQSQLTEVSNKIVDMDDLENLNAQEAYDELSGGEENNDQRGTKKSESPDLEKTRVFAIPSMINQEILILNKCVGMAKKASFGRQDYKIRKAIEIISEVIRRENNTHVKFLIFTEFISTQYYLGEILENLGYKVAYLNGRMELDGKIEAKTKFKEDHQILISTDAGGEGINLQFCHVIINYDLPWNPMKIEQRIGRLDRIGQTKDVLIFNLILKDTVEERVREVLDEKLDLIAFQFGDDKKADVLNLLNDEFNFDRIFIDALRHKEKQKPELEKIGEDIFNKAKEILEKQDLIIPFSEQTNYKELQSSIVDNGGNQVYNLIKMYLELRDIELKEYSNKKGVYHLEQSRNEYDLKNIVFDKELAIDNETFDYLNITHPLIKDIIDELIRKETLTFNIEIRDSKFNTKGLLFYYRIDLANNEGFCRRFLIPIFIDENCIYQEKISNWFETTDKYTINTGVSSLYYSRLEESITQAKLILDNKIKQIFSLTKLELVKKLDHEQKKLNIYFEDKEKAINKIAIDNIREFKLKELSQQKINEKIVIEKKKNISPKIKLFAIANIKFK